MGIGQAITMPLFFSSNALYPEKLMPGWLQAISKVNPLSYEVDALRGLLIGTPDHLALDPRCWSLATVAGVTAAAALLPAAGPLRPRQQTGLGPLDRCQRHGWPPGAATASPEGQP